MEICVRTLHILGLIVVSSLNLKNEIIPKVNIFIKNRVSVGDKLDTF